VNILETASRHLDLGSGNRPRNPFAAREVFGLDLNPPREDRKSQNNVKVTIVQGDATLGIPFPDAHFSSVSAYDFLEHVPRVQQSSTETVLRFPFVWVMNEVWRVLVHGGTFIASTPAFPSSKAFQDPTHVNFITLGTHQYFTGPTPSARDYGFNGQFELQYAGWDAENNAWNPGQAKLGKIYRNFEHIFFKGGRSHITWRFVAVK